MDVAKLKKQNSTLLKARLNSGKFDSPEEKQVILDLLKLRGIDVSKFEITGPQLDDAADEAYEKICEENDPHKVEKLAKLLDDGTGRSRDFSELSEEEKATIISISKIPVSSEKVIVHKEVSPKPSSSKGEVIVPFTEDQQKIASQENLTKAERVRQLYDSGCSVKAIAKNTGWDYVNAYDTIKAYLKKKEKKD